jgi:heat shock protein HtpX
MNNNAKTVGLLAFLTALVWLGGAGLSNGNWLVGLGFAALLNLGAYFFSDKLALAASRARPADEIQLPQVHAIVRNLALRAEMPMPKVYLMDSPQPNAFATGRNPKHAAVAVTSGILSGLSYDELEGVIAHELAHVRNRDILIGSVAAMLAAALSVFARMAFFTGGGRDERNNPLAAILSLVALVLAPIGALFIRFAISRAREYQADASGAGLTGRPLQLASALQKIGLATARIPMRVNPAISSLYIENPLKAARPGGLMSLFSTHPPIEDRIRRLEEIAGGRRGVSR